MTAYGSMDKNEPVRTSFLSSLAAEMAPASSTSSATKPSAVPETTACTPASLVGTSTMVNTTPLVASTSLRWDSKVLAVAPATTATFLPFRSA